jgi:RNA polymerase sigma factor (sigma-70 family)
MPFVRPASSATGADDCSEFYTRYRRPLLAYVAMSFPSVDAEAIVQETFCRVLRHWTEVQQMRKPWPWLAVTARNLSRNSIRDNANTQSMGLTVDDQLQDPAPELDQFVETYDTLRKLGRAMRALTPLQRQLLRLLVEEGLSGAEAARRLGLSPGAGRMHLCRMRSRLTERFVGLGGELAVTPFALLAMFGRRMRALLSASRKTMTVGAPGVLASTLAIATTLGVVHIGITRIHNGSPGEQAIHISNANTRATSFVRSAAPGVRWRALPGTTSRQTRTYGEPPVAVPAVPAHRVMIAKDPTAPGTNADATITIDTPVGSESVYVAVTQSQNSRVKSVCSSLKACS